MSVAFEVEDDGKLLVVTAAGRVTHEDYEKAGQAVELHASTGIEKVLVIRSDQSSEVDVEYGASFGRKVGQLLSDNRIIVAVVLQTNQYDELAVDAVAFGEGARLAQFETEREAREWLKTVVPGPDID